jgi:hypothetical protein
VFHTVFAVSRKWGPFHNCIQCNRRNYVKQATDVIYSFFANMTTLLYLLFSAYNDDYRYNLQMLFYLNQKDDLKRYISDFLMDCTVHLTRMSALTTNISRSIVTQVSISKLTGEGAVSVVRYSSRNSVDSKFSSTHILRAKNLQHISV